MESHVQCEWGGSTAVVALGGSLGALRARIAAALGLASVSRLVDLDTDADVVDVDAIEDGDRLRVHGVARSAPPEAAAAVASSPPATLGADTTVVACVHGAGYDATRRLKFRLRAGATLAGVVASVSPNRSRDGVPGGYYRR